MRKPTPMSAHKAMHGVAYNPPPKPNKNAPLGQGGRFQALKQELSGKSGVTNPAGLAAYIGRKKYGARKLASLSAKGKKA